jgi:stathmin
LEAKKIADWTTKLAKIEETSRKKDEINNEFITHTKEALLAKMDQYEEKRESMINDIKEKVKVHAQEIEKARNSVQQQKTEERKALEDKLKAAATSREDNINKMLERLKEHVSAV